MVVVVAGSGIDMRNPSLIVFLMTHTHVLHVFLKYANRSGRLRPLNRKGCPAHAFPRNNDEKEQLLL